MPTFGDLVHQYRMAPSTALVEALESLQLSHHILNANFQELRAIPDAFVRDRELASIEARHATQLLLRDFVRRLHNYLAAVKTLVDHTRAFHARYGAAAELDTSLEERLQRLREEPVVRFLQEFRNPVLHSRLPEIALTITDAGGALRRQLTVAVEELMSIHEWSKHARRFIESASEGYYEDNRYVDLMTATSDYQSVISEFYNWYYVSVATAHATAIAEVTARRQELANLQRAIQQRGS